jgi:hypothetical protein
VGQIPEGKLHAYVKGAETTACGFGLDRMQRFEELKFSLMNPAARCRNAPGLPAQAPTRPWT